MGAPIVSHGLRAIVPAFLLLESRDRALATLRSQNIEALPRVEGQLWTRLASLAPAQTPKTPQIGSHGR